MNSAPQRRSTDTPEARAEFLRGLPKDGFVPAEEYLFVASPAARSLRADIDAFGERFWSLPPSDRRVEWQALACRAAIDRRSELRLQRMEPLLDSAGSAGEEFAGQPGMIVLALQELGTLSPPQRAVRRATFLRDVQPPLGPWQRAAAAVLDRRPDLAALDRPLIERIVSAGAGKWRPPRKPLPATFQEMASLNWNFPADVPAGPPPQPERPIAKPGSKVGIWILIVLTMMVVRIVTHSSSDSRPPRYAPKDSVPYWKKPLPKSPVIPNNFWEDQEEFLRKMREGKHPPYQIETKPSQPPKADVPPGKDSP